MIRYSEDLVRRILTDDPSVANLNVWHFNKIGDTGTSAISDALGTNTVINSLKLDNQGISAIGATKLAKALMINSTLRSLHLADNATVGDAGASSIANSLRYNFSLENLFLDGCGIRDAGATALAAAIGGTDGNRANTRLRGLYLGSNRISNHGARMIVDALRTNRSLIAFRATNNNITTEVENEIGELVFRNRMLKTHGDSCKKMGRAFYLRKGADGKSWRWTDPERIRDAATGDGMALEVLHRVLLRVLEKDISQKNGLRDLASKRLLFHGSDGRSNLLQIAFVKNSEGAKNLCKFLIDSLGTRGHAILRDDWDEDCHDLDPVDDDCGQSVWSLVPSGKPMSLTQHRRRVSAGHVHLAVRAAAENLSNRHRTLRPKESSGGFPGSLAGLNKLPQMTVHKLQKKQYSSQHVKKRTGCNESSTSSNMRAYLKDLNVLRDVFENRKAELVECLIPPNNGPQLLNCGPPIFEIEDIGKSYSDSPRSTHICGSLPSNERKGSIDMKSESVHHCVDEFDYLKLPEM